jgi:hypothetical protein
MEFKATKPIAVIAVFTNPATRTMEAVEIDILAERAFVIHHDNKTMNVGFRWGGYDSVGKFHIAVDLGASNRSIQANVQCSKCIKDQSATDHDANCEAAIWKACACDEKGNPVHDTEAIKAKVLLDSGKLKDIVEGGWNFDELELTYNGATVYKKEKAAK